MLHACLLCLPSLCHLYKCTSGDLECYCGQILSSQSSSVFPGQPTISRETSQYVWKKLAVVYSPKFLTNNDVILLLPLTWKTYYLCQQPFYGSLSGTTRVSQDEKKHSPTHQPDHHLIFISFFHLLRSISV